MRIDLHTHSNVSDGTQTPTELLEAAAAAGLDVIGLTDHDTTAGWDEGVAAAERFGVALVRGLEISTNHLGGGIHLLAYLPDPTSPSLLASLGKIINGRNSRVPAMLGKLRDLGYDIDIADVRRVGGQAAATGRPHVADALVSIGAVRDRDEAFATLLGPGLPAYVDRYAAPLIETIGLVTAAGGVSVIAHPWGRHGVENPSVEQLAGFKEAGLAGLEVDHNDHPPDVRERLRAVARDLDLIVTGSSDCHGLGKVGHDLGCNTTAPEEFDRLMEQAAEASAASGRTTPTVINP